MTSILGHQSTRRILFDFGDAALGGIFLELQGVVARDNSVRIATGQLDHAFLVLNIGGVIRIRKGSAGFVFGEIAIEIAIVGCQDEGRIAVDPQVLRSVGVPGSGVGTNARKDLDVVAIDQV